MIYLSPYILIHTHNVDVQFGTRSKEGQSQRLSNKNDDLMGSVVREQIQEAIAFKNIGKSMKSEYMVKWELYMRSCHELVRAVHESL